MDGKKVLFGVLGFSAAGTVTLFLFLPGAGRLEERDILKGASPGSASVTMGPPSSISRGSGAGPVRKKLSSPGPDVWEVSGKVVDQFGFSFPPEERVEVEISDGMGRVLARVSAGRDGRYAAGLSGITERLTLLAHTKTGLEGRTPVEHLLFHGGRRAVLPKVVIRRKVVIPVSVTPFTGMVEKLKLCGVESLKLQAFQRPRKLFGPPAGTLFFPSAGSLARFFWKWPSRSFSMWLFLDRRREVPWEMNR